MHRFSLGLAGYSIDVEMGSAEERVHVDARFGGFRIDPVEAPDFRVRVDRVAGLVVDQPSETPWPGARGVRTGPSRFRFERRGERIDIDLSERMVRATVGLEHRGSMEPVVDPTSLDTPLRLLLSCALPADGGMLLHACGYADGRGAVVFPAVSGGGKTTTAKKLPSEHVLSDDQVAVRSRDGSWRAYALPFIGLYGKATLAREARLRAMAFLGQGAPSRRDRLPVPTALARMMACAPWFVRDDRSVGRLLLVAERAAQEVPCYRLDLELETPMAPWLEAFLA